MKKLLLLFTSITLISACTHDEELYQYNDSATKMVGKWKLVSLEGESELDLDGDGEANLDIMIETNCYQNEFLQFIDETNGINMSKSYAEITVFPDFPASQPSSVECISETEDTPFTYTLTGNQVSFLQSFDEEDVTFVGTLDQDTLRILLPNAQIYFDEELNEILVEDIVMKYVKQ